MDFSVGDQVYIPGRCRLGKVVIVNGRFVVVRKLSTGTRYYVTTEELEAAQKRAIVPAAAFHDPAPRETVTPEQRALMRRLARCRLMPGSWDKRFVRDIQRADALTPRQVAALERLGHRYRRQLAAIVDDQDERLIRQADVDPTAPAGISGERWSDYNRKFNDLLMRGATP